MTEEKKTEAAMEDEAKAAKRQQVLRDFVRAEIDDESATVTGPQAEHVTELDFDMVELAGGKWVDHEIIVNDPRAPGRQIILAFQTWVRPFSDPDVQTYFQAAQTALLNQKDMAEEKRRFTERQEIDPAIQRALLQRTLAHRAVTQWRSKVDPKNTMPLKNMECNPKNVLAVIEKFRHIYTDMLQALFDDSAGVNLAGEVASGLSQGSDAN